MVVRHQTWIEMIDRAQKAEARAAELVGVLDTSAERHLTLEARVAELEGELRKIAEYVDPCASVEEDFRAVQRIAEDAIEKRVADSVSQPQVHPDAERILKTLIQRVGGSVILTEHDRQRADRYQLRFTDNGHTLEIAAVDDT